MTLAPIHVAVLSPQEIVVRGMSHMLTDGTEPIEVDHEVGVTTDVVLYDVLGLHRGDGHDLDHALQHGRAPVLAVGRALRPDLLTQALARGAHGFLDPDVDADGLRRAVQQAPAMANRDHRGGVSEAPSVDAGSSSVAVMPSDLGNPRELMDLEVSLTDREVDVLTFIAHGLSNQEVADRCYLSINSVKTYIRSAYRKIGAESRTQAVIWAIQHGFSPHVP